MCFLLKKGAFVIPEISVVIPVFNREKTLGRAIESVLSQTFSNFEILIVDDCSTDASKDIARSFAAGDERIRVIELSENHGAAYCRNHGVENANADIIAFQDSDDVWRPNRLSVQMKAMRANHASVVIGRFDRHGYGELDGIFPTGDLKEGFVSLERVLKGELMATPSILIDRQLMLLNQFDTNLKWCEDLEWSYRIAEQTSFYLVDDVVMDVYLQTNSVSHASPEKKLPFFEKVLSAHKVTLEREPWFHANMLSAYAKQLILSGKSGSHYYYLAYKAAHRGRDLAKWILGSIGLVKYFLK